MKASNLKKILLSLMLVVGFAGTSVAQNYSETIVGSQQPSVEMDVPLYK